MLVFKIADKCELGLVGRARHDIYASELGQYATRESGVIYDSVDRTVIVAVTSDGAIAGFVAVTLPGGTYGLHRHVPNVVVPANAYEIGILSVIPAYRNKHLALALCYAAWRLAQSHSGDFGSPYIVAMGRDVVVGVYERLGLKCIGIDVPVGDVRYELMGGHIDVPPSYRVPPDIQWRLPFPAKSACYHGGAFFDAIGTAFETLEKACDVVSADVLDAWFPACPAAVAEVEKRLAWTLGTSPPAACDGLVNAIAAARRIPPSNIVVGAGSSDIIFRCFQKWLTGFDSVLVVTPTYGEYVHVLDNVIGCKVKHFKLEPPHFELDIVAFKDEIEQDAYDLVVVVNPNSPTGIYTNLREALEHVPQHTKVWIDETYIDFSGQPSLEQLAINSTSIVVCKSMSKAYALSGARVGYLCGPAPLVQTIRTATPPWVVSLPAQIAAVRALQSTEYYAGMWRQTHDLRRSLELELNLIGLDCVDGASANFLLVPVKGDVQHIVRECRARNVFLRDVSCDIGMPALRIAVKNPDQQLLIVQALRDVLKTQP